jgi:hypothetical protein
MFWKEMIDNNTNTYLPLYLEMLDRSVILSQRVEEGWLLQPYY